MQTLEDFIVAYIGICNRGWILTHRGGPTGIGKTLEDLLGIRANNLSAPDFGEYELKSCRFDSESMLTLFTKAPQPSGAIDTIRLKFGYSTDAYDNDEKVLHATLSSDRYVSISNTGHSLKVSCNQNKIAIIAEDDEEYAYWTSENLQKAFEQKYKNKLVYARAYSRGKGLAEEFRFVDAYEVSGFNFGTFIKLLMQGKIYVDLRIGQYHNGNRCGQTHDHGTGFRIKEKDILLLFGSCRKIV